VVSMQIASTKANKRFILSPPFYFTDAFVGFILTTL
jgi:hypothetical protein